MRYHGMAVIAFTNADLDINAYSRTGKFVLRERVYGTSESIAEFEIREESND